MLSYVFQALKTQSRISTWLLWCVWGCVFYWGASLSWPYSVSSVLSLLLMDVDGNTLGSIEAGGLEACSGRVNLKCL